MQVDLPYLEPLLFHLRNDESLKAFFTDRSFFMPKHTLVEATEEATKSDCPAPRALWILPGDSEAAAQKPGCASPMLHSFYIVVFVQCMRDTFELVKRQGGLELAGQYMELSKIRKAVKKSVNQFESKNRAGAGFLPYREITWQRDQNLYPEEDNFLTTAMHYNVLIN